MTTSVINMAEMFPKCVLEVTFSYSFMFLFHSDGYKAAVMKHFMC